jgi:hypothetical protein
LIRNVLASMSRAADHEVLQEHNLVELYDDEPEKALAALHTHVTGDAVRGSALFALAELSFLHAERSNKPSYHLAATPVTVPGDAFADDFLSLSTKVPVTAFLRLERPRWQLKGSRLEGTLEAYTLRTTFASDENTVIVGDRRVPLEIETTATAYALAESSGNRKSRFRQSGRGGEMRHAALGEPYRPGKFRSSWSMGPHPALDGGQPCSPGSSTIRGSPGTTSSGSSPTKRESDWVPAMLLRTP